MDSLNIKVTITIALLLLAWPSLLRADDTSKYAVYFTDKPTVNFDPFSYFDKKAIERRILHALPLYDWYDLPVNPDYLDRLCHEGASIRMHSRWLNAAVVYAGETDINRISRLPFVKAVEPMGEVKTLISAMPSAAEESYDSTMLIKQTGRMGADHWKQLQINGKGIRIAIFDAGFTGAERHPAFEYLHQQKKILKTWDFVKGKEFVWHGSTHGTGVWSCIGGMLKDQPVGLAWDAEFLLARTENAATEPFSEEENWVAAAEWADKNGADIINSSLGYTDKRYFPYQMDGRSTFVSRGANRAASKGMFVVNAAGNEGSNSWSIIGAPADADSVMTVGGVESCCDYHSGFSSFGPTWDKRLKPNVCAQSIVACAEMFGMGTSSGTSFASPLVAGFAACAWQYNRQLKNMELFRVIEQAGHLYPYYDYAHGYGIPRAEKLTGQLHADSSFSINSNDSGDSLFVEIMPGKFKPPVDQDKEEEDSQGIFDTHEQPEDLLYYQVQNPAGLISRYYVISVSGSRPLSFSKAAFSPGEKLRIFYKDQYSAISF